MGHDAHPPSPHLPQALLHFDLPSKKKFGVLFSNLHITTIFSPPREVHRHQEKRIASSSRKREPRRRLGKESHRRLSEGRVSSSPKRRPSIIAAQEKRVLSSSRRRCLPHTTRRNLGKIHQWTNGRSSHLNLKTTSAVPSWRKVHSQPSSQSQSPSSCQLLRPNNVVLDIASSTCVRSGPWSVSSSRNRV